MKSGAQVFSTKKSASQPLTNNGITERKQLDSQQDSKVDLLPNIPRGMFSCERLVGSLLRGESLASPIYSQDHRSMEIPSDDCVSEQQYSKTCFSELASNRSLPVQEQKQAGSDSNIVICEFSKAIDSQLGSAINIQTMDGMANNDLQNQPQPQITMHSPASVHQPVDSLTKKLRQQAGELTQVYELLEKSDHEMRSLRTTIKSQRQTIEKQRKKIDMLLSEPKQDTNASRLRERESSKIIAFGSRVTGNKQYVNMENQKTKLEEKQNELRVAIEKYENSTKRMEVALEKYIKSHTVIGEGTHCDANIPCMQDANAQLVKEIICIKAAELQVNGSEELLLVLAKMRQTIHDNGVEYNSKVEELKNCQEQLKCSKTENEKLQLRLDDAHNIVKEQETKSKELVMQLRVQIEKLQQKIRHDHEKYRAFKQKNKSIDTRLREVENINDTLQREVTEERKKNEKNEITIQEVQKSLNEWKLKHDNQLIKANNLADKTNKLQDHSSELKLIQDDLLLSIQSQKESEENLRIKNQELMASIKLLEQQSEHSKQQIGESTQKIKQLQAHVKELEDSITAQHQNNNRLSLLIQNIRNMFNKMHLNDTNPTENIAKTDLQSLEPSLSQLSIQQCLGYLEQLTADAYFRSSEFNEVFPCIAAFAVNLHKTIATIVQELEITESKWQQQVNNIARKCQSHEVTIQTLLEQNTNVNQEKYMQMESEPQQVKFSLETPHLEPQQRELLDNISPYQFSTIENINLLTIETPQQQAVISNQTQRIAQLLKQNKDLVKLETKLAREIALKNKQLRQSQHLNQQTDEMKHKIKYSDELLHEAAIITENHNKVLHDLKRNFTITLEAKARIEKRVRTICEHYLQLLQSQEHLHSKYQEYITHLQSTYNSRLSDIWHILTLLPKLIETYFTILYCTRRQYEQDLPTRDSQHSISDIQSTTSLIQSNADISDLDAISYCHSSQESTNILINCMENNTIQKQLNEIKQTFQNIKSHK